MKYLDKVRALFDRSPSELVTVQDVANGLNAPSISVYNAIVELTETGYLVRVEGRRGNHREPHRYKKRGDAPMSNLLAAWGVLNDAFHPRKTINEMRSQFNGAEVEDRRAQQTEFSLGTA